MFFCKKKRPQKRRNDSCVNQYDFSRVFTHLLQIQKFSVTLKFDINIVKRRIGFLCLFLILKLKFFYNVML